MRDNFDSGITPLMTTTNETTYRRYVSFINLTSTSERSVPHARPFWGDYAYAVFDLYSPYHGCLSIIICILGIVANFVNVKVLTRKELRSPTNIILIGIAVADLMTMFEYIPYAVIAFIYDLRRPPMVETLYEQKWRPMLVISHCHYFYVTRGISSCLHVGLAMWRYFSISSIGHRLSFAWMWRSNRAAIIITILTFIGVVISSAPVNFTYIVHTITIQTAAGNFTRYICKESEFALKNNGYWHKVIFAYTAIGGMLAPCLLMVIAMILLSGIIRKSDMNRQRIMANVRFATGGDLKPVQSTIDANRKTKLLIMITMLYMMSLLPVGVMIVFMPIYGPAFKDNLFDPLWCLTDIIALINTIVNFLLLVSMSASFRQMFYKIFLKDNHLLNPFTSSREPPSSSAGTASSDAYSRKNSNALSTVTQTTDALHPRQGIRRSHGMKSMENLLWPDVRLQQPPVSREEQPLNHRFRISEMIPDSVYAFIRSSTPDLQSHSILT